MEFLQPGSLAEAIAAKAEVPAAVPIAGGTDVMVEINFDARRPAALLDLNRVGELTTWERADGWIRLGAGVTYARLISELGEVLPGLAMAARTVGSPQIRNRGTVGGNLGAASPAGDCHPVLLATGAIVEVTSARGPRQIPAAEFYAGPKRNALAADELITSVLIPAAPGPQQFAKVGTRNAMVIAVCAFALELRPAGVSSARVGTGIGSAGPTPLRAPQAEAFLDGALAEAGLWESADVLPEPVTKRFGELAGAAARPVDDVRGTAAYRRHALSVLARRTLVWAWETYRQDRQAGA
ncbi:MAG TPA: FAD binding domain-containing protein [Streptosporangiaceae bacterium]|nr:FAD binding domain-containing protein [Streptosporangiaceae bacterium]